MERSERDKDKSEEQLQVTTYEMINKTPEVLNYAVFDDCGEDRVDMAVEKFLITIVGETVFKKFRKAYDDDYKDIFREFRIKKKSYTPAIRHANRLRIPCSLCKEYRDVKQTELKEAVENCAVYKGKISFARDMLTMDGAVFASIFDEPISNTIKHVKTILSDKASAGSDTIILVGACVETKLLQQAIKQNFPDKTVIIPGDRRLASLQGGVLFGHNPMMIK